MASSKPRTLACAECEGTGVHWPAGPNGHAPPPGWSWVQRCESWPQYRNDAAAAVALVNNGVGTKAMVRADNRPPTQLVAGPRRAREGRDRHHAGAAAGTGEDQHGRRHVRAARTRGPQQGGRGSAEDACRQRAGGGRVDADGRDGRGRGRRGRVLRRRLRGGRGRALRAAGAGEGAGGARRAARRGRRLRERGPVTALPLSPTPLTGASRAITLDVQC